MIVLSKPRSLLYILLSTSVAFTTWYFLKRKEHSSTLENGVQSISIFNFDSPESLSFANKLDFSSHASTNRTIWETVNSEQLHAGLERVEPGAEIPPHAHETEELFMVFSGEGAVYDAKGHVQMLYVGSMVHIKKHSTHSFKNLGNRPLLLMWILPKKPAQKDGFQFQQTYQDEKRV